MAVVIRHAGFRRRGDGNAHLEQRQPDLAVTCVCVIAQDQLDALYRELTAHPLVKVVL